MANTTSTLSFIVNADASMFDRAVDKIVTGSGKAERAVEQMAIGFKESLLDVSNVELKPLKLTKLEQSFDDAIFGGTGRGAAGKSTQLEFQRSLDASGARLVNLSNTMRSTSAESMRMASGGRNSTMALLELARAAEDASIGFSLNGLQGALRGAGNNIAAMATMINPMAGAIAGLAVAGLALAPMIYEWATAAKAAEDPFAKLNELLKDMVANSERFMKVNDQVATLRDIGRSTDSAGLASQLEGTQDRARMNRLAMEQKQSQLTAIEETIATQFPNLGYQEVPEEQKAALQEQLDQATKLRGEIAALSDDSSLLGKELSAIGKRMDELATEQTKGLQAAADDVRFQYENQNPFGSAMEWLNRTQSLNGLEPDVKMMGSKGELKNNPNAMFDSEGPTRLTSAVQAGSAEAISMMNRALQKGVDSAEKKQVEALTNNTAAIKEVANSFKAGGIVLAQMDDD